MRCQELVSSCSTWTQQQAHTPPGTRWQLSLTDYVDQSPTTRHASSGALPAFGPQAYSGSRYGHLRQQQGRRPGSASSRFSRPHALQHRAQGDRSALSLACPGKCSCRNAPLVADAHTRRLAGRANPLSYRIWKHAGALHRSHDVPRLVDGVPCAHHGAAGRFRQLFLASANRRSRSGVPGHESVFVLGHGRFGRWYDCRFFCSSQCGPDDLDRQRFALLPRCLAYRAQFHRHHARSSREGYDLAAHAAHRVGLVH